MTMEISLTIEGYALAEDEERRIMRQLGVLERRLVHRPEPTTRLVLRQERLQRTIAAQLQVQLGPLGPSLISHQRAATAERAVRLAVADIERQLERQLAKQRAEPTYGVPSRRLPAASRPARVAAAEPMEEPGSADES